MPINFLIFVNNYNALEGLGLNDNSGSILIDNIEITDVCGDELTITPTIISACTASEIIVEFEVCITGADETLKDVSLAAMIPDEPGLVFGGGDFIDGIAIVEDVEPNGDCPTATLILSTENSSLVQGNEVLINVSASASNTCHEPFTLSIILEDCCAPAPTPGFSYLDNDCGSFTFTANENGEDYVHFWDFGDSDTDNGQEVEHVYSAGNYSVQHYIYNDCGEEFFSGEESLEILLGEPDASFSATGNANGYLYTFEANSDDNNETHTWDFGDGSPEESGIEVTHLYLLPGNYTVTHTVTNACGSDVETVAITVTDPIEGCASCNGNNTVGVTGGQTTITAAISQGNLQPSGIAQVICVKGGLIVESGTGYQFANSIVRMQEGASIIVKKGASLDMYGSFFHGCSAMWRGIEVEKGGRLTMKTNNRVDDAQYAIYVHAAAEGEPTPFVDVETNVFVDNFVGIYMSGTAAGLVKAFVDGNGFYNAENLLSPFQGQSSAPEGLPQQASESLCGIYLDKLSGFSSTNNTFDGLSSGIVLNSTNGRIYRNIFSSIEPGAYPTYAFDGEAVAGRGAGGNFIDVEACTFSNCHAGIVAGQVALRAVSNEMNEVEYGATASLSNAGDITIGGEGDKRNTIHKSKVGVLANHIGTGQVSIINNDISSVAEDWGGGIALFFNHAPALVRENRIESHGATSGIAIWYGSQAELLNNHITLMDMEEVRVGIGLDYAYDCLLRDNRIEGQGLGGSENVGISLFSSPGNIYCCNVVDNTRIGVRVIADCETMDNFRGNEFGDHNIGLLLDAAGVLGTQTHMKNKWIGNGNAVYDGVTLQEALIYPFIADASVSSLFPPSHSPQGWFDDRQDPLPNENVCVEENCEADGFDPESSDSKRIAKKEIDVGEHTNVIQWHLDRYLYQKLEGYAGSDEDILEFILASDSNSVSAFDALEENIQVLLSDELEVQLQLKGNLVLISAHLEEIGTLDSLYLEADETGQDSLRLIREDLLDIIAALALENYGITKKINDLRSLSAVSLIEKNAGIDTIKVYEKNLKTVNEVFLGYLKEGFNQISGEDLGVLEGIAQQCPLEGGHAVFQARALLAVVTRQVPLYDDNTICEGEEAQRPSGYVNDVDRELLKKVRVFPNPARKQVIVDWENSNSQVSSIQLLDVYGQIRWQRKVEQTFKNLIIPLNQFEDGVYIILMRFPEGEFAKRIVISH